MKKLIAGTLLAASFVLAACGDNTAENPAADTATDTTSYDTGAVGETGATMISPTDTTGAAGAGADTGAAAGGTAASTMAPTDETTPAPDEAGSTSDVTP